MQFNFNNNFGWGTYRGVGATGLLPSELIQWYTGDTVLNLVGDVLIPLKVPTLAEYQDASPCATFDGVGDYATWSGNKSIDMTKGIGLSVKPLAVPPSFPLWIANVNSHVTDSSYVYIYHAVVAGELRIAVDADSNVIGHDYDYTFTGCDVGDWCDIAVKTNGDQIEFYLNGELKDSQTMMQAFTSFNMTSLSLGRFAPEASKYSNICLSDVRTGDIVFPMGDAASGEFTSNTGLVASLTTTSGSDVVQSWDVKAPATGAEYGGNLCVNNAVDNYTLADIVPNQGGTDVVMVEMWADVDTPSGLGFSGVVTMEGFRSMGMQWDGTFAVGGNPGFSFTDDDYRSTGWHRLYAKTVNTTPTQGLRYLEVDGSVEVNTPDHIVWPINADKQICLLALQSAGSGEWPTSVGSRVQVRVTNMTNPEVYYYDYRMQLNGKWKNVVTGVEYTPANGVYSPHVLTTNTVTDDCVNGLPTENYPSVLNDLMKSYLQKTSKYYKEGYPSLHSLDGVTLTPATLEMLQTHHGLGVTECHQGAYGCWLNVDGNNHIAEVKQYAPQANLTPAAWDLLEIEFDCVGNSSAVRDAGEYVTDENNHVVWDDYLTV